MDVFEVMEDLSCQQVVFCHDEATGLKAIIAFHDTTLGPALGGCRMRNYASEEEALMDVMRLARGMTLKSSISGLDFGGGKAVIWGDPHQKSEPMLRAMGRFVEGLNGRIITGTDMGTEPKDFAHMGKETRYLTSLPEEMGGRGDPSLMTATGVFHGIRACLEEVYGSDSMEGKTVSIQGVGKVGRHLARMLQEEGARIIACDPAEECLEMARKELNCQLAGPDEIYELEADVFSPNALGGVLNDSTVPGLKCKIVAGAANNQLAEARHGKMLWERGILYAPDFVINSGGLINVAAEYLQESEAKVDYKVRQIYTALKDIYKVARERDLPTSDVAEILAMERVDLIGKIRKIHVY